MAESGDGSAGPHRPARFHSVRGWLLDGMVRDWPGVLVALVVTWLYLPFAILNAAVGLVVGATTGALGGATVLTDAPVIGDHLDFSALQIGGVLGLLVGGAVGAVLGAAAGILLPVALFSGGDPLEAMLFLIGQVLTALVIGVLYLVYASRFEGSRLRIAGARRMSRREADFLLPLLRHCAERLEIAGPLPQVLVDDTREPNASASMGHIVVNIGLLEEFRYDPEPIAAVLSHELVHWHNGDSVNDNFIRGVALPLYLAYSALAWLLGVAQHPALKVVVWVLFWPVLVSVRFIVVPVLARDGRNGEFRADLGAVLTGHRAGMRQVLAHFRRTLDGALTGWDEAICASHPPNELRLERLEEGGVTYPLPDENAPPRPVPVAMSSSIIRD